MTNFMKLAKTFKLCEWWVFFKDKLQDWGSLMVFADIRDSLF